MINLYVGQMCIRDRASSLKSLGLETKVTRDAAAIRAADHIILPGVGAVSYTHLQAGAALATAAPVLRLADLWLLLGLVWGSLPAARRAVDDLKYTRSTRMMLVACGVLLAAHTVLRLYLIHISHRQCRLPPVRSHKS